MPRTKPKPKPEPAAQSQAVPPAGNGLAGEVLTLAEAAAYLRLPEKDVIHAATAEGLPGRLLRGEWRFFRAAIQQWLSTPRPTAETRKAAQLAVVGSWKDDPYLEGMLEEIYRSRGRPITEDGSYRLFHDLNPESDRP